MDKFEHTNLSTVCVGNVSIDIMYQIQFSKRNIKILFENYNFGRFIVTWTNTERSSY